MHLAGCRCLGRPAGRPLATTRATVWLWRPPTIASTAQQRAVLCCASCGRRPPWLGGGVASPMLPRALPSVRRAAAGAARRSSSSGSDVSSTNLLARQQYHHRRWLTELPAERERELTRLQQQLGYTFRQPRLLDAALTHPSVRGTQHPAGHHQPDAARGSQVGDPVSGGGSGGDSEEEGEGEERERLEFLGDHVLGLVAATALFQAYPRASEGELTTRLRCDNTYCADVQLCT
jgi:hypothetical protein